LPESLTRIGRFDRSIRVETPRGKDAEAIVKYYLDKKKNVKDVNAALVAKILNGTSCSTLETVINEAGVYAGFENKNYIDMDDIIKACLRILYEAPEVVDNADKGHINEIAYHEAGHAVIAEVLTPESVSIVSVKRHDGSTAGFTVNCLTDDYWNNMDDMENRVISILGGKAATELVYGKVDSGVSSDLRRAWDIVERFVANYAAYGFYYYHYAGYRRDASEKTLTKQDDTIQLQLQHYYDDAKKILINNREFLDKMAAFLVEKETITYNDIQQIKATCKIVR
ncbi:MAG: AAA family ATPase, partial [Clostridia bacterium]|nr:AAA family ATPase [Clostridia bacterium]